MKVIFKVEKNYNGKTYYPNIEYVVDDEVAKDIFSKTKYVEKVEEVQESPVISGRNDEKVDDIEPKRTKRSKKMV